MLGGESIRASPIIRGVPADGGASVDAVPTDPSVTHDLGYTAGVAEAFAPYRGSYRPGRVARVDRGGADVFVVDGSSIARVRTTFGGAVLSDAAQDRARLPAVGDWVAVRTWTDDRITLDVVLPRRSALVRDSADRSSQSQVLATNVDVVVIVEPLDPDPDLDRIERLMTLAHGSGARPMIALTKSDLVPDAEAMVAEVAEAAPRARVVSIAIPDDTGVDDLAHSMAGVTSVLIGPSGAGKSSLINAFVGANTQTVGDVRPDGTGRHTTVRRDLVVVPGRGAIIDTPGLRAVGLVASQDAVVAAFADIAEYAVSCRFRDCAHDSEPGCAVQDAVATGLLDERRVEAWHKLRREAARHDLRSWERRRRNEWPAHWTYRPRR